MYNLVRDAQHGDSNSFAILYSISYNDIYDKCRRILNDEYDIQDIIFNTYVAAHKNLRALSSANYIDKWINILFESQLSVFLKKRDDNIKKYYFKLHPIIRQNKKKLDEDNAEQLLESVFMAVGAPKHDVPLSSLAAYHSYRNNRLALQKGILVIAILALVFIPFFTMKPNMIVEKNTKASKYDQIHYTIDVSSFLPISTVFATQDNKDMTVMVDGDKIYDARATQNGKMIITATAINGKSVSTEVDVTGIDTFDPVVNSYALDNGKIVVEASDEGSGLDYEKSVVAKLSEGLLTPPIEYDDSTGKMIFDYYVGDTALTIYDKAGNYSTYTVNP